MKRLGEGVVCLFVCLAWLLPESVTVSSDKEPHSIGKLISEALAAVENPRSAAVTPAWGLCLSTEIPYGRFTGTFGLVFLKSKRCCRCLQI